MNLRDRNSPALSVCSDPTTRTGAGDLLLHGVRVHGRDERADLLGRLGFRLQEVDELEARVIVDEHQGVLVTAEEGSDEGAHDICVHESAGVRRLVLRVSVRQPSGVGFGTDGAGEVSCRRNVLGCVGGVVAEAPEVVE